jgi:hypothetical protein
MVLVEEEQAWLVRGETVGLARRLSRGVSKWRRRQGRARRRGIKGRSRF